MVLHIPYRSWCPECVMGRGKEDAHFTNNRHGDLPFFICDYCFMSSKADDGSDSSNSSDSDTLIVFIVKTNRNNWLLSKNRMKQLNIRLTNRFEQNTFFINRLTGLIIDIHYHLLWRSFYLLIKVNSLLRLLLNLCAKNHNWFLMSSKSQFQEHNSLW